MLTATFSAQLAARVGKRSRPVSPSDGGQEFRECQAERHNEEAHQVVADEGSQGEAPPQRPHAGSHTEAQNGNRVEMPRAVRKYSEQAEGSPYQCTADEAAKVVVAARPVNAGPPAETVEPSC